MNLLLTLLIGSLVGAAAAVITGRLEQLGASTVVGVTGAVFFAILAYALSGQSNLLFSWSNLFWSFIGAIFSAVLLYLPNFLPNKKT